MRAWSRYGIVKRRDSLSRRTEGSLVVGVLEEEDGERKRVSWRDVRIPPPSPRGTGFRPRCRLAGEGHHSRFRGLSP